MFVNVRVCVCGGGSASAHVRTRGLCTCRLAFVCVRAQKPSRAESLIEKEREAAKKPETASLIEVPGPGRYPSQIDLIVAARPLTTSALIPRPTSRQSQLGC